MTVIDDVRPSTSRRRRYIWWSCFAAAVIAVVIGGPVTNWYDNHPHGTPDPGGARIGYLTRSAHAAIPVGATAAHVTVKGFAWDAGGCDGGSAGWARGVVNASFRNATSAAVDATMASIGWKVSRWIGGVRDYVPANRNPYDSDATLFTSHGLWTLNFSAAPAQVPTHSC